MSCIKASIEYFYFKFYEIFGQKKNTFCMDLNFNPNTWNSKKKCPPVIVIFHEFINIG